MLFNKRFLFLMVAILLMGNVSCKDIVFDNPLDPNASQEVVQVIKVIDTPLSGSGDIAFDTEKFWKISTYGDLTAFDRETGMIIRSFTSTPGTGVAFFRDSIFTCGNQGSNLLIEIDSLSGDIVDRISTGGLYPRFITAGPTEMILFDQRSNSLFEYDPETGDSYRLFGVSGLNVGGIAYYKGGLLITDMNTDSLYRFTITGEPMAVYSSPTSGVGGVGVDLSEYVYLFIVDGKIYKVSLP